jgi:hypothetical protein
LTTAGGLGIFLYPSIPLLVSLEGKMLRIVVILFALVSPASAQVLEDQALQEQRNRCYQVTSLSAVGGA